MLAGRTDNDMGEIIDALRIICPDLGYIIENGKLILIGSDIERVMNILAKLSGIERIISLNKYQTRAVVTIIQNQDCRVILQNRIEEKPMCINA